MIETPQVKRIAAVHDLSGYGRVSLMVVLPILSTMGFEVSALPTAVLSNHTQFPKFTFLDLTDEMRKIIESWKSLDARFDAIYTGYLGSPAQIDIIESFIDDFRQPQTLVVVDPVMGDNGRLYQVIDAEMVGRMRSLIRKADVVTPNLTELYYLLDKPYEPQVSTEDMKKLMCELSENGPDTVIVTGVPIAGDPSKTSVFAYSRQSGHYWKVTCAYLPAHYPGTGDAFTSVITGALMQGDSLPMAIDRAAQFILQGIRATFGYKYDSRQGILLERVLHNLTLPVQNYTYEMISD